MRFEGSSKDSKLHLYILSRVITNPSDSDRPGNITFCASDHLTLLQDFTSTLISESVHEPPHLRHSISPCLEAEITEFLGRECASHFRWTERLGWLSRGEKSLKVVVQRRCCIRGHDDYWRRYRYEIGPRRVLILLSPFFCDYTSEHCCMDIVTCTVEQLSRSLAARPPPRFPQRRA